MSETPINRDILIDLKDQLQQSIIGQSDTIDLLLTSILAGGHVLLIGVPGLAKTKLVKSLAGLLNWKFSRIQFTPDLMPADILGMEILKQNESGQKELKFIPGPVFTNLLLADEINRTPPRTQSALLEAMQEKQVTINHEQYKLDPPFIVIATQNPIEQEGTYPLPEAQLDRFMFSLWMDYPSQSDEVTIARIRDPDPIGAEDRQAIDEQPSDQVALNKATFIALKRQVQQMEVTDETVNFAVNIARATRPQSQQSDQTPSDMIERFVQLGAGTRACQHLVQAAQAHAYLKGHSSVAMDDLTAIAPVVLQHRIIMTYQGTLESSPRQIIDYAIEKTIASTESYAASV